jgi:NADH-quinone oxidoreductase subunit G
MPTFKLDGREIPFEKGDTIIRAAHRAGIDIPHYCWHPGLSVAANCRMCLVEIAPPPGQRAMQLDILEWDAEKQDYVPAKKPKLQPACQMPVADGMDVKSETSAEVERARSAVQELLLLNHPVDCPICDQAGECRLQDYWLEHQGTRKRMRDEPIHKPKAVVFGPTIVYDAERCIVCTRCVRVSAELAKDPVLDERERGNLTEIVVSPGRQLDHDYTLMTEHVCPVGALTSKDFRFKARVWFLRSSRTICQGCATGCNAFLDYDPRDQKPYRHRPRENMAVNTYWMCDDGMLSYSRAVEHRVLEPRVAGKPATMDAALEEAKRLFAGADPAKIAVVLSAQHSNEDNFALAELARTFLGAKALFVSGRPKGKGDDILMHEDKNPNRAGVKQIAPDVQHVESLFQGMKDGKFTHVLALGAEVPFDGKIATGWLARAGGVVTIAAHEGPLVEGAGVVLPACTWAEAEGTYVNAKGIAQPSERAIAAHGQSRPAWELVSMLGRALGYATDWKKLKEVRRAMTPATASQDVAPSP